MVKEFLQDLGYITKLYPAREWNIWTVLKELNLHGKLILGDLGCGTGKSYETLIQLIPEMTYVGIDIADSPEVLARSRTDLDFVSFDGVNLPFSENYFDIIFCNQVFEHVRYQEKLLSEVRRVLKDTGIFLGSLSGIEPYHSYSIFNLTPYGWMKILNDNGFLLYTLRPGVDGATLIKRHYHHALHEKFVIAQPSEMNQSILSLQISDIEKNRLMLNLAGHMIFVAYPR